MTISHLVESEDDREEALRAALEASKQAYLSSQPADRPAALRAFKAAIVHFNEYTTRHTRLGRLGLTER